MNIVLIGMSGAGKSTLGVLLAKALGMNYIDTDIVIQNQEGRLLQGILAEDGISKFMEIEERIVSELQLENCIISTGGSVVYSEKAMNYLKQGAKIIYLQLPYEELQRRLSDITTRGIVIKEGYSLEDVFKERVPLYIRHSDRILNCSNKSIEECVNELIRMIHE